MGLINKKSVLAFIKADKKNVFNIIPTSIKKFFCYN